MLRLALPVLCCAALLWGRPGVDAEPRAVRGAPAFVAEKPVAAAVADLENSSPATGPSALEAGQPTCDPPPQGEPPPLDPAEMRQHDVRDLVAMGFDVEELALQIGHAAKVPEGIASRVNVLEVVAPEAIQAAVERLLEERRRTGPCDLRIHPVAELVCTTEELEAMQAETCRELGVGPDFFEPVEPKQPFEIDSLVEVILQTIGEGVRSITPQGRNLVVYAEPAAQRRIADFLDDLRSNCERDDAPR